MTRILTALTVLMFIMMMGCSSGGHITSPDVQEPEAAAYPSSHYNWGLWQFSGDEGTGTLDVVQLRGGNLHLNAVRFLEPPVGVYLTVESFEFNAGLLEVDIGIRHPFLGMDKYTGFDVSGILITTGSVSGYTDAALAIPGSGDTRLMNPDGYSRWWNPVEFPVNNGTMFSYIDGGLGIPQSVGNFDATLNPYKYFCDDLANPDDSLDNVTLENRGMFTAGQKNVRHYTIKKAPGALMFNYVVDANWKMPLGSPPFDIPGDFPDDANRTEAWRISITEVENTLWNDGVDSGGDLSISINVHDWYNGEMNTVRVESPGNFTMVETETPVGGGEGFYTYEFQITDATPGQGEIPVLVSVISEGEDFQTFIPGTNTAAYNVHWASVEGEPVLLQLIDPNGGEFATIDFEYLIAWIGDPGITSVRLDYSTDSGATYPNTITGSTENDGVFEWTVPDDPTILARVRIQSVAGPSAEDESDDDFTIGDASGEFIYGMAEVGFTYNVNSTSADNDQMFINLLNLPLTGPYSTGTKVLWYWGHADDYSCDNTGFIDFMTGQGYTYESNGDATLTASHLTNVKMMIISCLFPSESDPVFTATEIQLIKDFMNGGGVCIVLMDNCGVMSHYTVIDNLLDDLGADFSATHDLNTDSPYTDITDSDPAMQNCSLIKGNSGGCWTLDGPLAVSLVRESVTEYTAIVKSPIAQ